jgi:predicted acylesterase/phospholipase RssA
MVEPWSRILFSSGGGAGTSFFGAMMLLKLKWPDLINNVSEFGGASIGALFAFFCVTNQNLMEMFELSHAIIASLSAISINPAAFVSQRAILPVHPAREMVEYLIIRMFGKPDVTFSELYHITQKHLVVSAVNVLNCKLCYFDYVRTPDVNVCDAVVASMSIPFVWSPVLIDDGVFVDGACIEPVPIHGFQASDRPPLVLFLTSVLTTVDYPLSGVGYMKQILTCTSYAREFLTLQYVNRDSNDIILIRTVAGVIPLDSTKLSTVVMCGMFATSSYLIAHDHDPDVTYALVVQCLLEFASKSKLVS